MVIPNAHHLLVSTHESILKRGLSDAPTLVVARLSYNDQRSRFICGSIPASALTSAKFVKKPSLTQAPSQGIAGFIAGGGPTSVWQKTAARHFAGRLPLRNTQLEATAISSNRRSPAMLLRAPLLSSGRRLCL
ncbi:unnamed protein product [Parajaminaea phylloscopi]